jgi:hypothetical protein
LFFEAPASANKVATVFVNLWTFVSSPTLHSKRSELNKGLAPRNRALLEKLTVAHLVKKFAAFYEIPSFITVYTRACHWTLS